MNSKNVQNTEYIKNDLWTQEIVDVKYTLVAFKVNIWMVRYLSP